MGAAASAACSGAYATSADCKVVAALMRACGICVKVNEYQMDAVTGVSGSGPAYVFQFIEAMADGGVAAGLPRKDAQQLAAQTVFGAAKMVLETGEHPGVLKDRVCSPGGTTIRAVHALEQGGMRGTVINAVLVGPGFAVFGRAHMAVADFRITDSRFAVVGCMWRNQIDCSNFSSSDRHLCPLEICEGQMLTAASCNVVWSLVC